MSEKNKTRSVSAAIAIAMLTAIVISSAAEEDTMKIRITVNGKAITATLIDSETTRDFISLLPLTLTMNDLFGREKFGHLPRAISEEGKRTQTYEVGDVIYWSLDKMWPCSTAMTGSRFLPLGSSLWER